MFYAILYHTKVTEEGTICYSPPIYGRVCLVRRYKQLYSTAAVRLHMLVDAYQTWAWSKQVFSWDLSTTVENLNRNLRSI